MRVELRRDMEATFWEVFSRSSGSATVQKTLNGVAGRVQSDRDKQGVCRFHATVNAMFISSESAVQDGVCSALHGCQPRDPHFNGRQVTPKGSRMLPA